MTAADEINAASVLRQPCQRRGAVLVEVAVIAPVAFLLILILIVGAIAVFRSQQVEALAREGARWASVHGPLYAKQSGKPLPSPQEVYQQAMKPLAASLNEDKLVYTVTYDQDNATVTVSVAYRWLPGAFHLDFPVKSTAEISFSN